MSKSKKSSKRNRVCRSDTKVDVVKSDVPLLSKLLPPVGSKKKAKAVNLDIPAALDRRDPKDPGGDKHRDKMLAKGKKETWLREQREAKAVKKPETAKAKAEADSTINKHRKVEAERQKVEHAKPEPKAKASAKASNKQENDVTKSKKAKAKVNGKPKAKANGGKSQLEKIGEMLKRKGGCSRAEVLAATGWPAVSMQQQAKALGLLSKLRKSKERPFRYSIVV